MDARVWIVLAPAVAVGVADDSVGPDDKLPWQLERIVNQGTVGAVAACRQIEARLRLAAQKWIRSVEEDLRGCALEQTVLRVDPSFRVAQDRDLELLAFAVAGRPKRLTLTDDRDLSASGLIVGELHAEARGAIHTARASEVAPEQEQDRAVSPEGRERFRSAVVVRQDGIRSRLTDLRRQGRPAETARPGLPDRFPAVLGGVNQVDGRVYQVTVP